MATEKRNLSEWRNETKEAGLRLDNLIEATEDKPYAYILIAVEKESDGTNIGVQVNGKGLLLAQGLASFLAKDDYTSLIQAANHLVVAGLMDEPNEAPEYADDDEPGVEPTDELIALLRSIFGDK